MGETGGMSPADIAALTNALQQQINQLGYKIKTQMLQDRLDDRNRQLLNAQNQLDNARQSQFILGNMGRYVAWEGSGSQTTSTITA